MRLPPNVVLSDAGFIHPNRSIRYWPGDDIIINRQQEASSYATTCSGRCSKVLQFPDTDAPSRAIFAATASAPCRWALAWAFESDMEDQSSKKSVGCPHYVARPVIFLIAKNLS